MWGKKLLTLVGLLRDCPDRLAADLRRFFGVSLRDMWAGRISVVEVADCAAHIPRGGAVGEWFGGFYAVTAEVEAVWELSHILAQVNSKKKVKPREMPEGVRDREARAAKAAARAEKWLRRQELRRADG